MTSSSSGLIRALPFLWAFAILFAPAADEVRIGSQAHQGPIGARVLAPTVREAIVVVGRKETAPGREMPDHRSGTESPLLLIALAAASALLVWVMFAGPREATRSPLVAARPLIPRAPPSPLAA